MKTTKGKVSTEEDLTEEELEKEMETGGKDVDVYKEKGAEILQEGDEISDLEEGFVEGYEEDTAKCALCGKIIKTDEPVELKIKGEHYMFCSEEHAEEFKKQHNR